MDSKSDLVVYSYNELQYITGGFDCANLIGHTQFGRVFRGKIYRGSETQEVTVKTWEDPPQPALYQPYQESRLQAEIELLTTSSLKSHPYMVKLIGYCCENKHLAVVYDLKSLDSLRTLIRSDNFGWIARMKLALEFAGLLELLHSQQLVLRNVDAAHIMFDQAFNPKLFDFGLLANESLGAELQIGKTFNPLGGAFGSHGYIDPYVVSTGIWSKKTDVFSYGVLLLALISKRVYDRKMIHGPKPDHRFLKLWAAEEYKRCKSKSLVHKSIVKEPSFDACDGPKITELAMRCVVDHPEKRPTIREVVCCLQELSVCKGCGRPPRETPHDESCCSLFARIKCL